uniref:GWxTD domain-containing protein n=1 Tax=candidate division WOR-3 bacterium TaxID=2052148 RepID=A0A7C4XEF4_UNCW3
MNIIIYFLFSIIDIQTALYKFDEGYCEFWYRIPLAHIFSMNEFTIAGDSIIKEYAYEITVYPSEGRDSTQRKGIKIAVIRNNQKDGYIIDCIPLYLPSGAFSYRFIINSGGEKIMKNSEIVVLPDTTLFYTSDIILSSKLARDAHFIRQGIQLFPLLNPVYSNRDTLFSYLEIYGLVPDTLFYEICYQVRDSLSNILFNQKFRRPKYDYKQFDTLSISLSNYSTGRYKLFMEIFEPALDLKIQKECDFEVKEALPDITDEEFAWEIKYLVSEKDYKKFCGLNYVGKIQYLKKFWSKRNYREFENRLIEADKKFSNSFMKGRDTPMGKFYITNGPPDEIKRYGLERIKTPNQYRDGELEKAHELWIYESKGIEVLFTDTDKDGIYESVNIFRLGHQEFMDWLKDRRELEGYLR